MRKAAVLLALLVPNIVTAQWNRMGSSGLGSANVGAMAATSTVVLAGCYYDVGVWRSTDSGATWAAANVGLTNKWVVGLSEIGGNIFAGTDGAGGIFRSTNQGQSWVQMNSGLKGWQDGIYYVKTFFRAHDTWIFAATNYGVFCSTNGGGTWTEKNNGLVQFPTSALAAIGETMFASTNSGVFRSTDYGVSWVKANNGITQDIITCLAAKDNKLFAGTIGGIFASTDSGASWSTANNGLPFPATSVLSLTDIDSRLVAGTWDGVYVSSDNGTSWQAFNSGMEGINIEVVVSSGSALFAGATHNGVWRRPLPEMITQTQVAEGNFAPGEFSLEQNYPNPFNPFTIIKYTVGGTRGSGLGTGEAGVGEAGTGGSGVGSRNTRLVVYDLLGREVAVLVNAVKQPGFYDVTFDGSGLASGVYIYQMRAGSFVQSKKMILIK